MIDAARQALIIPLPTIYAARVRYAVVLSQVVVTSPSLKRRDLLGRWLGGTLLGVATGVASRWHRQLVSY
jgi:hypothetical protein